MKNQIKKLIAVILLTLGTIFVSLAQTHYEKTVRTQGKDILIDSLAINKRPRGPEFKKTRILAKNGIEFAITFPEKYQNLSIVRNDTNIVIEGRKIKVIGPGHLSFEFTYTENGVSYTCDILGHVNYYGELRYQGTSLTSRNITITQSNDLSKGISAAPKMAGVWWRVKVGSGYVDICEGTQTRTLQELLDFAKSKGVNGKAEFEVEFSDGTSNRFYKDGALVEGSYSVQYFSIEDTRTYNLNLSQEGQGTVSVSKNQLKSGESATLTARAAQGWRFDHWEENGQNVTENPLTITMGTQDRSIKAVFTELPKPKVNVILQIVDTNGGELAPSQSQEVTSGGTVTFQVPNLANVSFKGWKRNGQIVETGSSYTLSNVTQNETIQAVFEIPVQSLSLSFTELSLKVGESKPLPSVTVIPSNASDQTITWVSNDPGIAKIENGKVVGVSSGTIQIIASSTNSKTTALTVKVSLKDEPQPQQPQEVPVQSITVTPASITAKVGEGPIQLAATVLPANATSKTVTWISENEQVVKVDSSGKVTIIGAGETAIEAKAGEKTFTVEVKIEAQSQQPQPQQPQPQEPQVVPVQSITVSPTSITAKVGEGPIRLTATVLPANATNKTVTWTSKNEQAVKVDSTGKVTIIGAGETAIEAKAGEKTFTVQVKIEAQSQQPQEPQPQQPQNPKVLVESLSLSFAELSLKVGEAKDLPSVTITPSNATDQAITWISNKPEVAKVENGKVVGVSSGTVQIIASSTNNKTAMLNVTVIPENQVAEEDFPPYVKELPSFKVGQVVNLDDLVWERRDGIEVEEYLLLDTQGKLLPLGTEYQREANKLTFSVARVFVLVVKFKQNARNWQQVEFTIEVKP
jgi:putative alpha-amylase (fragment)